MKKTYIKPQIMMIALNASTILAGSELEYGGSNAGGGPGSAESKGAFDYDWEEEEFY